MKKQNKENLKKDNKNTFDNNIKEIASKIDKIIKQVEAIEHNKIGKILKQLDDLQTDILLL